MDNTKGTLFNIDLRIDGKLTKLKVYQEDNLADLVNRLFTSITSKSVSKDQLTSKLQNQFRKIIHQKEVSNKVKEKLQSLLDQSKLIIVGIETDKNEVQLDETPFKILQQSAMNGRKASSSKIKKNFQYMDEGNLNAKYQSQDIGLQRNQQQHPGEAYFENLIIRTKSMHPRLGDEFTSLITKQDVVAKSPSFIRKYINQTQIVRRQKQITHFDPNINIYQPNKKPLVAQFNDGYQTLIRTNNQRLNEQHPLRSISGNRFHQEANSNPTYNQYKIAYKSSALGKNQHQREQNYHPLSSRQNIKPSKSYTKLNVCYENQANTIRNYDGNTCQTKRNYDSLLDTKMLNEAVSSKRLKGKFNYLRE